MKANEESLVRFAEHLRAEVECLEHLYAVLESEAVALRQVALVELNELARRKERIIDQHLGLAKRRAEYLAEHRLGIDAGDLPETSESAEEPQAESVAELTSRLRALATAVRDQNHKNHIFAESGKGLIQSLFRLFDIGRSRLDSTYAADGQIRGSVLNAQGNKGRACLV